MLAIDVVALSVIYWLAVVGRHLITPGNFRFYIELFPGIVLFVLAFSIQGLYPGVLLHPAEEIRRIFHCVSIVLLLVLCTTFLWHNAQSYSRSIVMVFWALGAPAVLLARYAGRTLLARTGWWGVSAVVFGSGAAVQRVLHTLRDSRLGVRVVGVVSDCLSNTPVSSAHYAIIAMAHNSELALQHLIQDYCKGYRHILLVPDLPGVCSSGITAREIGGEIGFELPQRLCHRTTGIVKRSLDLLLSIPAILLLSPVFLLIAAAIKLTSRGPVFFGHSRHGRNGDAFKAFKFRTMFLNGDAMLLEHLRRYPDELAAWNRDQKLKNDPRVTRVGKWLRRYSLDELPQIWNVVLGHMSLVGPRPIVAAEVSRYGHGYGLYTRVLPGMTGLWQVSGRNNTTYEERVSLDEYYVRNWSIWLDTYILVRTIKVILTAEGAY
jgi:Undecaprenyl-phosphate galactose phosphotransferase WbaP